MEEDINYPKNTIYKWREKNRDKYNKYQREYHNKRMLEDEEYKKTFNERCRINSQMRRMKKNNGIMKPVGRPKKQKKVVSINDIPSVSYIYLNES
jgi:hypothetical protein